MSRPEAADRWGLRTLMTRTLDPGYALAFAARNRPSRTAAITMVVVLLLAGMVIGVTARQQQLQSTERQAAAAALIERIETKQGEVDTLDAEATALRQQVAALREQALSSTVEGQSLLDALAEQEIAAGLTEVTGPGISITIADPAPAEPNDPLGHGQTVDQEGLVSDTDLQEAVNALWASGAEAIAINGYRIGPITAIRQAGGAVLIDFRPTAAPYVLEVIGDSASLPGKFAATSAARRFSTYRTAFGAEYSVHIAGELNLPAAAEPVTAGDTSIGGG